MGHPGFLRAVPPVCRADPRCGTGLQPVFFDGDNGVSALPSHPARSHANRFLTVAALLCPQQHWQQADQWHPIRTQLCPALWHRL